MVTTATNCFAVKPLCWLDVGVDRQYLDPRMLPVDSLRLWYLHYRQAADMPETAKLHADMARAIARSAPAST